MGLLVCGFGLFIFLLMFLLGELRLKLRCLFQEYGFIVENILCIVYSTEIEKSSKSV